MFEERYRGAIQPSGYNTTESLSLSRPLQSDGAQQSVAGSTRIQAPFHRMPVLIAHNNRHADGASLEIRRCP